MKEVIFGLLYISRGRLTVTITTQGDSAWFAQEAETPTRCRQYRRNLDGTIRDFLKQGGVTSHTAKHGGSNPVLLGKL